MNRLNHAKIHQPSSNMYFKYKNKEQKRIILNLNNTNLPGALLTSHESGWENIFASHIWTLIFPKQKTAPFKH